MFLFSVNLLNSSVIVAAPLVLAAMGGVISHKAGIFNFSLEGLMLCGAFFAVYGTIVSGNPWIGLFLAVIASCLLSVVYAFVVISLKADPIIAAFGVNLLGLGGTSFLLQVLLGQTGQVRSPAGLGNAFPQGIANAPLLGPLVAGWSWPVIAALFAGAAVHLFLHRTPLGLHITAAGEAPEAAEAAGVNVAVMRYVALALTGAFCGLAGAQLSIGFLSLFTQNMTNSRGFIAFAAVIFGGNKPWPAFWAAMFFGVASAATDRLQNAGLPGELVVLVPYAVTVVALAVASQRIRATRQLTY